ncbi:probable splicing factor YJU2B [Erpetoichthys calabaricus]|uniref:Probable splicing factor YJU2B n=1 Tax=Erpetoichthys calabaricus TaxID=27687 RepID=A0A8C4T6Q8_ERPCA|nr:probable splicing factor YJU2B [Erpetoichthys calabaricus]XP_028678348.1 probable splicing factor YJU2B [Erpetoichthys calabaricus]
MGERKGVNKYYPPDFDPAKHGSINGYWKTHPLRERARKLSQGILIIRFEMPYNIWCDGCKNHIGMGVRYNAEKKKVGNYYSTPIYRFRMKCHLCVNYIEMQTDPANCDYVIVSGAQRKEERWDMKDNEQILTTEHGEKEKLETDAMFKLEHGTQDKEKLQRAIPSLANIIDMQEAWKDDFQLNCQLRNKFREEKKLIKEEAEKDETLLRKASLCIPLVKENKEDRRLASLLTFRSANSFEDKQKIKRKEITERPWFLTSPTDKTAGTLKKLGLIGKGSIGKTVLSKPTTGTLGIIRRKSDTGGPDGTDAANSAEGRDAEETNVSSKHEPVVPDGEITDNPCEGQSADSVVKVDDGYQAEDDNSTASSVNLSSLVPDYSDSGSDPEA